MIKEKSFRDLQYLLYPKSIAVVGATTNLLRVGARIIDNTKRVGFKGKIYPVNPKYDEVLGFKCYPSLADIPDEVDSIWIALPNEAVVTSLEEAERKGVKVATVYSSGWGETGDEGRKKEGELKGWLRNHHIRFLGPNTIGVGNTYSKVISGFNSAMSFLTFANPGNIGFVSQSGAMVGGIVGRAEERGIELAYYIHTGNEVDINTIDAMEFMVNDEKIKVILGYIEGIRDVDGFYRVTELAHRMGKPIILFKTGRSEKGKEAVSSHTGAIAGSDRVYDAVFKQRGIVRVDNHEDLFETASLFSRFHKCTPIKKGGVLIFSPSGGAASIFADKAADLGITLPELSEETKAGLREVLPPYSAPANPFDIGGGVFTDPSIADKCLDVVCRDENVDILTWTLVGPPRNPLTAKMIEGFIHVSKKYNKPVAAHTLAGYLNEEGFKAFAQANSPTFDSIENCLKAIKKYIDYSQFMKRCPAGTPLQTSIPPRSANFEKAEELLTSSERRLTEYQSKKLLSYYGIPIPKGDLAHSIEEAVSIAQGFGYPVVLKISSPQILHKTEAGGIALNIADKSQLVEAYQKIMNSAKAYDPCAAIEGVLVEEMAKDGTEVIVGSLRDPQFGPAVMFGLGGIFVEILKDVSLRSVPFNAEDARSMLGEIKAYEVLKGFRGQPKADIDALVEVIMKVQRLSWELKHWISEVDINPLVVFPHGQGVKALDALIQLGKG
jgi:acetyltransferase